MARSLWSQKDLGKCTFVFTLTALERLGLALASVRGLLLMLVRATFRLRAEFQA